MRVLSKTLKIMDMRWQGILGYVKVNIIGYGPCSVNIVKPLYNNDYYCAKITIHGFDLF